MIEVVKRSARAPLFDGQGRLVLIKRVRPGQEPYWVAVGGGVGPGNVALRREVREELGGRIHQVRQVLLITDEFPGGIGLQYVFTARLTSMDLGARTGPEPTEPGRGTCEVVLLPATRRALSRICLLPPRLADFVLTNRADRAIFMPGGPHSSGTGDGTESPLG